MEREKIGEATGHMCLEMPALLAEQEGLGYSSRISVARRYPVTNQLKMTMAFSSSAGPFWPTLVR